MLQFIFYGPILVIVSSLLRLPILKNKFNKDHEEKPVLDQIRDVATAFIPLAIAFFFIWLFSIVTLPLISQNVIATLLFIYSGVDYINTTSQYENLSKNTRMIPLQIIMFLNSKRILGIVKQIPKAVFSTSWIRASFHFIRNLGRIITTTFMLPISAFQGVLIPIMTASTLIALMGVSIYYPHTTHILSLLSILTTLILCYVGYTQFITLGLLLPVLSINKLLHQYALMPRRYIEYLTQVSAVALWFIYLTPIVIDTIPINLLIIFFYGSLAVLAFHKENLSLLLAGLSIFIGIALWPYVSSLHILFILVNTITPTIYLYQRFMKINPKSAHHFIATYIFSAFISLALLPIKTHAYRLLPLAILSATGLALKYKAANIAFQIIVSLVITSTLIIPSAIPAGMTYILSILSFIIATLPHFKWQYSKSKKRNDKPHLMLTISSLMLLLPEVLGLFMHGVFKSTLPLLSVTGAIICIAIAYLSDIKASIQTPLKLASFGVLLSTCSKVIQLHPATKAPAHIIAKVGELTTSLSSSVASAKRLENHR